MTLLEGGQHTLHAYYDCVFHTVFHHGSRWHSKVSHRKEPGQKWGRHLTPRWYQCLMRKGALPQHYYYEFMHHKRFHRNNHQSLPFLWEILIQLVLSEIQAFTILKIPSKSKHVTKIENWSEESKLIQTTQLWIRT